MRDVPNNNDNSILETVSDGVRLVTGILRANTAELLEKKTRRNRAEAEALRQAQARVIPSIADPQVREAFRLQQGIEVRELSAMSTQVEMARFDKHTQYIEAGHGGLGLASEYGDGAGIGIETPTLLLGTSLLAFLAGRSAARDTEDEKFSTVPVLSGT